GWSELLGEGLDAVVIASFDDDHAEQIVEAVEAGIHVFCEKPLCRTEGEVRAVREAVAAHPDVVVTSNLVLRAAPLWRRLRDDIAAGRLGSVYSLDADYLYGRLHKITDGWRGEVAGYSVMLGGGVHMVDLAIGLLGEGPAEVVATGNGIATAGSGFGEDDFSAATFRFPSGTVGRVTANFGCVHRHQHVVRVFGTEATVIVDDLGARRYVERDPGGEPEWLAEDALPAHKGALVPEFIAAIMGRKHALPGLDHELAVVEACLAADRASASGQTAVISQATARGIDEM
ncbi:MAG: Gfo/Idh/MocA family protein, partial [Miltoncostaeaceae bacterium]